ncbi:MAG: periplasmic heavy metal sensor [Deltaproteobacteria bacterium]|nr:periplasmic heavy metal sensor [Deltaproteobacteria bacterium]
MKKMIAAMALVATIGFLGIQQAGAQRGPQGWTGGPGAANCPKVTGAAQAPVMDEETRQIYNAFMDATVELRKEMFSKREQMRALQFADPVDEQKIDALAQEMFDLRTQIQEKATELGWQGGFGGGFGPGCDGPGRGRGCNGPWSNQN